MTGHDALGERFLQIFDRITLVQRAKWRRDRQWTVANLADCVAARAIGANNNQPALRSRRQHLLAPGSRGRQRENNGQGVGDTIPSCMALCMPPRKPTTPPRMSHRRVVVGFILAGGKRHARDWLNPDEMVPHALDAGDIFGGDDQAGTLAIIGNYAVQFSDTRVDNNIDARCPILFADRGKDLVANCQIARSWRGDVAAQTRQRVHEIGAADDPDHTPAAGNRKAFDVMAFHRIDHRFERLVFTDRAWIERS